VSPRRCVLGRRGLLCRKVPRQDLSLKARDHSAPPAFAEWHDLGPEMPLPMSKPKRAMTGARIATRVDASQRLFFRAHFENPGIAPLHVFFGIEFCSGCCVDESKESLACRDVARPDERCIRVRSN
jgi:hypothetical protein